MKSEVISSLLGIIFFFGLCVLNVQADINAQSQTYPLTTRAELVDTKISPIDVDSAASEPKILRRAKRVPNWTTDEVELLLKLKAEGKSWEEIKEFFPQRSLPSLQNKLSKLTPKQQKQVKTNWTTDEEELLLKLKAKGKSWREIKEFFPERSIPSLRIKFKSLFPIPLAQTRWTAKEDGFLIESVESGMPYEEISQMLRRGTEAIKQRVYKLRKSNRLPQLSTGHRYTADDFELMREMRKKGKTWAAIAYEFFPERPWNGMRQAHSNNEKKKQNEKKEE